MPVLCLVFLKFCLGFACSAVKRMGKLPLILSVPPGQFLGKCSVQKKIGVVTLSSIQPWRGEERRTMDIRPLSVYCVNRVLCPVSQPYPNPPLWKHVTSTALLP